MANIDAFLTQLNADLDAAYAENDEGFTHEDATTFNAWFTLLAADDTIELTDKATNHTAELRYRPASITLENEDIITRDADSTTWMVEGKPEADGYGENIAQLRRVTRDRVGGR